MMARELLAWLRTKVRWVLLAVAILAGYWLLPINGRVIVMTDEGADLWPRFRLDDARPEPGGPATVSVTDVQPWSFVELLVNGVPATSRGRAIAQAGTWTWTWTYPVPDADGYALVFYHDCHTGCIERGSLVVGMPPAPSPTGLPTKLGLVMPDLNRDWHGRSGWAVEVTYAKRPEAPYWGVDELAQRVAVHEAKGLRVLVRVDYDQQQTVPPTNDYVAMAEYLAYFRRLAGDDRLDDVYGYIVGSDFNTEEAATATPDRPITPEWYARVFNGYGEAPSNPDNVIQIVRSENPNTRVLVGPLRPWVATPGSAEDDVAPWLTYMDRLVSLIGEAATQKEQAGVPLARPDGFDVQSPGSPDAPEMAGVLRSDEPLTDLSREAWGGAQAGFRVFEDWMAIVNAYPATRGLPIYIISTNTYDREAGIPPAQNYPRGWLTTAVDAVNAEPQVVALVWFLDDFPHDDEWDWFSLTEKPGRLVDAAEEFDALLQMP